LISLACSLGLDVAAQVYLLPSTNIIVARRPSSSNSNGAPREAATNQRDRPRAQIRKQQQFAKVLTLSLFFLCST
jgi:hypothetical protein